MLLSGLSLWQKLVRNRVYGASIPKSQRRAGRRSRPRDWSAAVERLEDRTLLSNVAVFDNGSFVDTAGGAFAESDNVQASLSSLGHTVSTFTGTSASAINSALAGKDVLLIPEQENGNLVAALDSSARSAIQNFVSNGGGLIIHGFSNRADDFLNGVFGFSTFEAFVSTSSFNKTAAAAGTEFADDPSSIPWNNGTGELLSGLPAGSKSIYSNASGTAVALMPFGAGQITYLGWDWFNAAPVGSQDGGWLQVLDSAVEQVSPSASVGLLANDGSDTAVVFDPSTNTVIGSVAIPGGGTIGDAVVTADGRLGFVTDFRSHVWVIDLTTPTPTLGNGGNPILISNPGEDISITPDQKFLVVSDGSATAPLSVVSIASLSQVSTFSLGHDFNSVDVAEDGSVLFSSWQTSRIGRLTMNASGVLADTGFSLSVSNAMNVYAAPGATSGVVVTLSGQIQSFLMSGLAPVDSRSLSAQFVSAAFSPTGDRLYARNRNGTIFAYGFNSSSGALSATPLFTISVSPANSFFGMDQLAVSRDGSRLYVPQPSSLNVYNTTTASLVASITHPSISGGTGIAVSGAVHVAPNEPPVANANGPYIVNEGSSITLSSAGSTDVDGTLSTFEWDFDFDGVFNVDATGASPVFSASSLDGPLTRTVALRVTDNDGATDLDTATVTVNNLAPVVTVTALSAVIDENGTASLSFNAIDPGTLDTFSLVIDWGDGTSSSFGPASLGTGSFSFGTIHQYLDDNPSGSPADEYTIGITVTDDDGGVGTATATVTVNNVAPHDVAINAAVSELVFAVGSPQAFGGSFGDVGTADTHTAAWTFSHVVGTGTVIETRTGAVNQTADTVDNAFSFAEAGVYTVTLTVTDDDSGVTSSESKTFVVYDPSEGFVTGGGWIDSPVGAYVPDATLTGKATFGFVSKYKKGQTTPTGNTTFQFKVADLEFKSTSYDWLVVAGARAQYKGEGTINGAGNYGFLLTAIDGQVNGGGGTDKFRMKIWDKDNGDAIVYDNALGASDNDAPPTALGGGSVIIHTNGNAETAAPGAAGNGEFPVLSYDILQPVVEQAIAYWAAAGVDAQQIDLLHQVDVQIADLDGPLLGMASVVNMVWIDVDAAGIGWSVTDTGAFSGFDLVSVVSHELGHVLGLDDISDLSDVMGEYLSPGVRRLPDGQTEQAPIRHGDETAATVDFPLIALQSAPEFEGIDGAENDGRWNAAAYDPQPWIGERFKFAEEDDLLAFSFDDSASDTMLQTADEQDGMDAVFADVDNAWDELLLV